MADETDETSEPTEPTEHDEVAPDANAEAGGTPTAGTPTEETAAVGEPAAVPADETQPAAGVPASPPPGAPAAPAAEHSYLRVPTWAAVVVGAVLAVLVLFGGGLAVGRWTADDNGSTRTISVPSTDQFPQFVPSNPDQVPRGVARAFFGVVVESSNGGVAVVRVSSDSPAEDAGVKSGDVITKVDGKDVSTPAEFADAIHAHDPGDSVTVTYTRDGDTNEVTVHLDDRLQQVTPND